MRMYNKSFNWAVIMLVLVLSGLTAAQNSDKNSFSKEFDAKPGDLLTVDLRTGGSIKIEGWYEDKVKIDMRWRTKYDDEVVVDAESYSGGVELYTEFDGWGNNNNGIRLECQIMVPQKYNVEFKTNGGGVDLINIEGELEGETMGGSLDLSKLKGNLSLSTMGGSIDLDDSDVDGKVSTMGGSIDMNNVIGNVSAKTMGGSISQRNVKGRDGSGGGVEISTMGGSIDIDEAPDGVNVSTMGGSIEANKVKKFIIAKTMGGSIKISEIDGWAKASTMGGDVEVYMTGDPDEGRRDVDLSSMGGDIELYVPEGLSMEFDIEIKMDGFQDGYQIISDFPVETEVRKRGRDDDDDYWGDGRYSVLRGTGEVNGGKNKIKIRTVNGDVYVKKNTY